MSLWKPLTVVSAEDPVSGALILRLAGALTDSPESYAVLERVRTELQKQPRTIVLNLERVDAVTSSGIGVIAAAHSSAVSRGAKVCVTSLSPRVKALFHLVHLHTLIPEFDSEAGAFTGHERSGH
jgi:anti-anti-sigma factor